MFNKIINVLLRLCKKKDYHLHIGLNNQFQLKHVGTVRPVKEYGSWNEALQSFRNLVFIDSCLVVDAFVVPTMQVFLDDCVKATHISYQIFDDGIEKAIYISNTVNLVAIYWADNVTILHGEDNITNMVKKQYQNFLMGDVNKKIMALKHRQLRKKVNSN